MRFLGIVAVVSALGACGAAQKAAQEDPQKCEQDPKCTKKRMRAADCSTQCVDDPACMERCEQMSKPNGPLGH
jgi:hypothetical protein